MLLSRTNTRFNGASTLIFSSPLDTHYLCISASGIGIRGESMRILIADDHEIIRSSVIRVLQSRTDVECAEATNGKEAVEKALECKPDLILLDVRLPLLSGIEAAQEIKQHAPEIPILFFSIHDANEILEEAKLVGDGFILKDKIVGMLPNALAALLDGQTFFPSDIQTEPDA